MRTSRRSRIGRLLVGLAALACCTNNAPPVGGLLSSPAGMALANSLLFLANQDGNELHVFDTDLLQFRPSPSLMFPLSVPTVRRPGAVCGNALEMFTTSTVDPTLGVIDAFDDPTNPDPADPPRGLREVGEMALPGVASDAICTEMPSAVLAHKSLAGGPAQYAQEVDAGLLIIDGINGVLPDGGLDERHAVAALPMAALLTFNDPGLTCPGGGCSGTQIWQATNDISGAACGLAAPAFCPTLQPLFALPPQPATCEPVGPPQALRVDVSGANAGDVNEGVPNVDPSTLNRLMAADQNSNCVASVNLDDMSVDWFQANGPTNEVFAMPYFPNSCLPGGDLFAAVFAGEQCERQGPPPVGGYPNCGGVSFLSVGGGGLLPEPLPYPFKPRRPMPPVRIFDFVERVTFIGPDVVVSNSETLLTPVPFQMLAIVGTGSGDMVYIDIGIGRPDAGTGADDAGQFACPAAYLAPRLLDINDYITDPIPPEISEVEATYVDGGPSLGSVTQLVTPEAFTAQGVPTPNLDRQGATFATPLGSNGLAIPSLSCYSIPIGSQVCVTGGLVQKGTAQTEIFVATYNGSLPGLAEIPGNLSGSSLQITSAGDLTQINGGLLVSEGVDGGNLSVQLTTSSSDGCGDYGISAVTPTSLTLNGSPTCGPGGVSVTIVASGQKPFTVQGTSTGFLNQLWPMDGTLHLVTSQRWHYPADLIGMLRGAEQLADFVLGPIPAQAAPGSLVTFPRDDGADSDALDSAFGLALIGPLGIVAEPDAGVDAGVMMLDGGLEVVPLPGATWSFNVTNGVQPLLVNPTAAGGQLPGDSLIDGMASYTELDGGALVPHVFASFRGGNALVELVPSVADPLDLYIFH